MRLKKNKHTKLPLRLFYKKCSKPTKLRHKKVSIPDAVIHTHSRVDDLTSPRSKQYMDELIAYGFRKYLCKSIGGGKTEVAANQIIHQESIFLEWFENDPHQLDVSERREFTAYNIILKLFYIYATHPYSLATFISQLEEIKHCKPMTCYNYIWSNTHTLHWLLADYNYALRTLPCGNTFSYDAYIARTKRLTRQCRKANRTHMIEIGDIDTLVDEKRWPRGGLADIQRAVNASMEWAKQLVFIIILLIHLLCNNNNSL